MADVKTMTDAQRLAHYTADIQRAKAAGLTDKQGGGHTFAKDASTVAPGAGMIRSSDTARHVQAEAQRHASKIENLLTPTEIVQANAAGRQAAYARGERDGNKVSAAGNAAVRAAADAKVTK